MKTIEQKSCVAKTFFCSNKKH